MTQILQPPTDIDPRALLGNPTRAFLDGPPAWQVGTPAPGLTILHYLHSNLLYFLDFF